MPMPRSTNPLKLDLLMCWPAHSLNGEVTEQQYCEIEESTTSKMLSVIPSYLATKFGVNYINVKSGHTGVSENLIKYEKEWKRHQVSNQNINRTKTYENGGNENKN